MMGIADGIVHNILDGLEQECLVSPHWTGFQVQLQIQFLELSQLQGGHQVLLENSCQVKFLIFLLTQIKGGGIED